MKAAKRFRGEIKRGDEPLITIGTAASNRTHFGPPVSDDEDTEIQVPEESVPPKQTIDWDTSHERNGITSKSGPIDHELVRQRAEKRKAEAKSPIAILMKAIKELEGKSF